MLNDFDEQWYLRRYPDIAAAIAEGKIASGLAHYERHGRVEGRLGTPPLGNNFIPPARAYQSFPGESGDSRSEQKFLALQAPSMAGARVLDVGCNEGFFCFKAALQNAAHVVGMDRNADVLAAAETRKQQFGQAALSIDFLCQSWDNLPEGEFDIIFLLSALHYSSDQAALIASLVKKLSDSGVLILECGVIYDERNEFVEIKRDIDTVLFPTFGKLKQIFESYAWKTIGYSVSQIGDPIQRMVFHIRKLKPIVLLLLSTSYTGKTTLARIMSRSGVSTLMIDDHVRLKKDKKDIDPRLLEIISKDYDGNRIDQLYWTMWRTGTLEILIDDIIDTLKTREKAVHIVEGALGADTSITAMVVKRFEERGFFTWVVRPGRGASGQDTVPESEIAAATIQMAERKV